MYIGVSPSLLPMPPPILIPRDSRAFFRIVTVFCDSWGPSIRKAFLRNCAISVLEWSYAPAVATHPGSGTMAVNSDRQIENINDVFTWNWLGDGFAVLLVVWAWLGSVSLLVSRYLRLRLAVCCHRVGAVDVERLQGSIRRLELLHAGTPCLHLLHLLPLPVDGLVDGHVVLALRQIVEGLIDHAVRAPVVEVVVPNRLLAPVVVHLTLLPVAVGSQVVSLAQGVAVRVPRSGGGRGLGPGVTHLDTCKVENLISLSEIGKTNFPPGWLCGPGCASWQSASSSSPEIVEDWAEVFFLATTSTTFSLFWANW